MFEVTVEEQFSSGHYLRDYHGKCENPHGHNYRVHVTLHGAELDPSGLLLDFKQLKQVLKEILDYLDHKMINEIEPFIVTNPTAENMAHYIYHECQRGLRGLGVTRANVKSVTLWETDTSFATYYE